MTSTEQLPTEVEAFLSEVRHELDDLPPRVVDDLVDGLDADLSETLADSETSLSQTAGSPQSYAAELRAAAGLPLRTEPSMPTGRPTLSHQVRGSLTGLRASLAGLPEVPTIRPLWQLALQLRPTWWLVRAYVAVALLLLISTPDPLSSFPLLSAGSGGPGIWPAALLLVGACAGSVWLGRRTLHGAARGLTVVGNVFAALAGLAVLWAGSHSNVAHDVPADTAFAVSSGYGQLPPMTNIYAFTTDGALLRNVLLYDQDGQPIGPDGLASSDIDGRQVVNDLLRDAAGEEVLNLFPLRQTVVGWDGRDSVEQLPPRPVLPRIDVDTTLVQPAPTDERPLDELHTDPQPTDDAATPSPRSTAE